MSESEVTRLRRQIETELEAMQRGMLGFAIGTARHEFIRVRMDRVDGYQGKLVDRVGEDQAAQMLYGIYAKTIG